MTKTTTGPDTVHGGERNGGVAKTPGLAPQGVGANLGVAL